MGPIKKLTLLLSFIIILTRPVFSTITEQGFEFKLVKDKKGVKVYKSLTKSEDGILPIKGETILNLPYENVKEVLDNHQLMKKWVPDLDEVQILETNKADTIIQYLRYNAPWPFSDRTFLLKMKIENNQKLKKVRYSVHSITDSRFPLQKKYVRGHTEFGYVKAESLGKNSTKVSMFIFTDLKGYIPKWIVRYTQLSWPKTMFHNLKNIILKEGAK